jgi:uncharacterized OB-fold protein
LNKPLLPADPRPTVDGQQLVGVQCEQCGRPSAFPDTWCRRCQGPVRPARFGPGGTVWASATIHLPVDHREPPFTVAYVDLDRGPRVLTLVKGADSLSPETRVRLVGELQGDLVVEEATDA